MREMIKKENVSQRYFSIKLLSGIGMLFAVYLLWEQFTHSEFQPCNINSMVNCNAIISGGVSKTFGIPTPLYGLAGYSIIFFSSVFQKKKLLLMTTMLGLLFCLWIGYKEFFLLHVICPVCILCELIMITVFTFAVLINKPIKL